MDHGKKKAFSACLEHFVLELNLVLYYTFHTQASQSTLQSNESDNRDSSDCVDKCDRY